MGKLARFVRGHCYNISANRLRDVLLFVKAEAHLDDWLRVPCWTTTVADDPPAREILATRSQLIHLPSGATMPATPRLFTTVAGDYEYSVDAPQPDKWLDFLVQIWPEDAQAIEALQEWCGYCLLPDTSLQKILLMVGPRRSGKGTVARILTAVLGRGNVAGPTLASLGTNFGLWPLVGKSLAIIADARLGSRSDRGAITERLLAISGEDLLTIDRKFAEPISIKLDSRLMLMSNELPRLGDASGALSSRMILLQMTRSFYGQENDRLTSELMEERAGILLWAIEGWKRLQARRRFVQPDSGREELDALERMTS